MIKKVVFLLVLLVFSTAAYSVTNREINLRYGESVLVSGRNITLSSVYYEKLIVNVDGNNFIYPVDKISEHEGVGIGVELIYEKNSYRDLSVDLNITVYYVCGDGICDKAYGESGSFCCSDCNCSSMYSCFKNRCVKSDSISCFSDSECNDSDSCTVDVCGGDSIVGCNHSKITRCINNDGCCPGNCQYSQDDDCKLGNVSINTAKTEKQCQDDSDCDDGDVSTADKCAALTNLCYHYPSGDGSINNVSSKINITEPEIKSCRNDSDCNDHNASTIDKCSEVGKVCYYIPVEKNNNSVNNMVTGAATTDVGWNSKKKEKNLVSKFLDWLLGWI